MISVIDSQLANQHARAIAGINAFDPTVPAADVKAKLNWTDERIAHAVEEYRSFLALCAMFPDVTLAPPADADEIWHAHMLHSARYAADCQAIAGTFLHHSPGVASTIQSVAWERTVTLGQKVLGVDFTSAANCVREGANCVREAANCVREGANCVREATVN